MQAVSKIKIRNILAIIIGIIGVVICIYSIFHHIELKTYGSTDFACNINSTFSCDAVVMTKYSEIFGIPLGVFGVGYFLSMVFLASMSLLCLDSRKKWIHTYVVMSLIGCGVSLIYGCISKFIIGALCPSCMSIYTVTAIQFILLLIFIKTLPKLGSWKEEILDVIYGGVVSSFIVGGSILVFFILSFLFANTSAPALSMKEDIGVEQVLSSDIENIQINKKDNLYPTNDFRKGPDNAKVEMVIFSDFQCKGCQKLAEYIEKEFKSFEDKILIVYKNNPMDSHCNKKIKRKYHEYACEAATLARCLGKIGMFWEYHDILFKNRLDINSENLVAWAKELGLNDLQIDSCKISSEIAQAINRDLIVVDNLGISLSPTIFINGRRFIARRYDLLKKEIQNILNSKEQTNLKVESAMDKISRLLKEDKAILLDVREENEWEQSHFKIATHIPLSKIQEEGSSAVKLPTNKVIYIHCRSGMRAQKAADILNRLGYESFPLRMSYENVKEELGLEEVSGR